jgi:hypothetical protein
MITNGCIAKFFTFLEMKHNCCWNAEFKQVDLLQTGAPSLVMSQADISTLTEDSKCI